MSLFNNTTSSDTKAMKVSAKNSVNYAPGVSVDTAITATFSETMDTDSITPPTHFFSSSPN
ncbi:MAG: Ig-like domain-containing protein [Planctomycetia bacterium]|nr:Ig-like domain-containing protein [Planctomycetia bacterium]